MIKYDFIDNEKAKGFVSTNSKVIVIFVAKVDSIVFSFEVIKNTNLHSEIKFIIAPYSLVSAFKELSLTEFADVSASQVFAYNGFW